MSTIFTVKVGDLVMANFEDEIYIMALATCVSFVSIDQFNRKILATHFLCPELSDVSSHNKMSFVYPGLELAMDKFEIFANTSINNCKNYLIGGITENYAQIGGNVGDLNICTSRKILSKRCIKAEETVGGKDSKTVHVKEGILTVHFVSGTSSY